jgi:hypothetical protein
VREELEEVIQQNHGLKKELAQVNQELKKKVSQLT